MPERLHISNVRLCRASYADRRSGLIGWISFVLNESILHDGIALRLTHGRPYLSFPARRDNDGKDHPYVRPVDDDVRREIEGQVFAQLDLAEVSP